MEGGAPARVQGYRMSCTVRRAVGSTCPAVCMNAELTIVLLRSLVQHDLESSKLHCSKDRCARDHARGPPASRLPRPRHTLCESNAVPQLLYTVKEKDEVSSWIGREEA